VLNDLHAFALKDGAQFTEGEWTENLEWVKQQLKREMYITAFSVEDSRKLGVEYDPIVLKAIDSLPKAKNLLESAKKLIVQRTQQRKTER
jgi:hypothetical protein